jgi:hypothetical protein
MMRIKKEKLDYLLPFAVALIAFAIGYIHHEWFYPLYFNGDAAALHVLAKTIIDEGSLLPGDFSYGNQLVFLRSSPFIALASLGGLADYKAFVVGSALSIAFWSVVLHWFLSAYFQSQKKSLLFTTLLIIPLGGWDVDLLLGQQSHLSNAVLALGTIVSFHRHLLEKNNFFLIVGCFCLFLMSSEAPIRGLLVLAPALIAIALTANLRSLIAVSFCTISTFFASYILNKSLIKFHPISIDHFNTLTIKSSNEFFANILKTTIETAGAVSSLNEVSGAKLSVLGLVVFTAGMLLVTAYFSFIFAGALKAARLGSIKLANPSQLQSYSGENDADLISLTAILGVIIGAFAVSAINPDSSRHYLWAIFLVKFTIFISLYDVASRVIKNIWAGIFVLSGTLVMSSWFANLVVHDWNTEKYISARNLPEEVRQIRRISEQTGIHNIYGEDFWRMMPLNTVLHDINAQALLLSGSDLQIYSWLTRPSWSCVAGDVLYFVKNGPVDKVIEEKLKGVGGARVHNGGGYSLWTGPRVWQIPLTAGCHVSSLAFDNNSQLPAIHDFAK